MLRLANLKILTLESAYKDSKNCFYCLKVCEYHWRSCEFRSLDSIDLQLQNTSTSINRNNIF